MKKEDGLRRPLVLRDDQMEFSWLLDAVKRSKAEGMLVNVIDSGILSLPQVEWLGGAGAHVYTSDEARQDLLEVELISRSCRKGGAITAFFHHGSFGGEGENASLPGLKALGGAGVYIHVSGRIHDRSPDQLLALSFHCRKGGSRLIYFHHGLLSPALEELAKSGAWLHISGKSLKEDKDVILLAHVIKAARLSGVNVIYYPEGRQRYHWLREVVAAGGHVLFENMPVDYRSPLKSLERAGRKKELDFRSHYLYTSVFL